MYSLIVRHKDQDIIHRTLTHDELSALDGFGVQWVVNAFKEYIGLIFLVIDWMNMITQTKLSFFI